MKSNKAESKEFKGPAGDFSPIEPPRKFKQGSETVSFEKLLLARARAQTMDVSFTMKADSFEATMLEIAAQHYTGGAAVDLDRAASMVCRMIVIDWLQHRVDFPALEMGSAGYPLKRFDPPLTKLE
jgi:hypothetical protein